MLLLASSDPKSTFWFSISVILLTYDSDAILSTGAEIAGVAVNVTSKINNIFRTIPSIYTELYHKYTIQVNKKKSAEADFYISFGIVRPIKSIADANVSRVIWTICRRRARVASSTSSRKIGQL